MAVWVALLRGINLGARNKVPMPALREALAGSGCADVRTYVQSGNVLLRSRHRSPAAVARLVRTVVRREFGVDTPVVVRTPAELAAVRDWNPFPGAAAERPELVQVTHLFEVPTPQAVRTLLADVRGLREQVAVRAAEVVVEHADSVHSSRVQGAWLARRLGGVEGTARNWRTLTALCELTAD